MDYSVTFPLIVAIFTILSTGGGVALLRKAEKDRAFRRETENTLAALVPAVALDKVHELALVAVEAAKTAQRAAQFVVDATDGKADTVE